MTSANTQYNIRDTWAANAEQSFSPVAEVQPMGTFYVHHAAPIKGAKPAADGKCFYLLECFPVPSDATPGQVRDMVFDPSDAQYRVYYGHISRRKDEAGLVVGYVERCFGTDRLAVAVEDMPGRKVVTEMDSLSYPRPRVKYNPNYPYYGEKAHMIADIDETIALVRAVDAIRNPRFSKPASRGLRCLGG